MEDSDCCVVVCVSYQVPRAVSPENAVVDRLERYRTHFIVVVVCHDSKSCVIGLGAGCFGCFFCFTLSADVFSEESNGANYVYFAEFASYATGGAFGQLLCGLFCCHTFAFPSNVEVGEFARL